VNFCLLCLRHDCNHFQVPPHLTVREVLTLSLLMKGWPYPRVAAAMHTTPGTVRVYMAAASKKLGLHSKGELTAWAIENRVGLKAMERALEERRAPGNHLPR